MVLQPILFFAALLWAVGLTLVGIFMLFRHASHRISLRDRILGFVSMTVIGLAGGALLVGSAIILGEVF